MISTKPLRNILTAKLIARLAMRWTQSQAYAPAGSTTVHCPGQLTDEDRAAFDSYVLGYQDAIDDIVRNFDETGTVPPQPYAMSMAECSPFQGGAPQTPTKERRLDSKTGRSTANRKKDRLHSSEALLQLNNLFSKGAND